MKHLRHAVLLAAALLLAPAGFADTLVLRNGDTIAGFYEGGTSRIIRFRTDDGVREFDLLSVSGIRFGDDVADSRAVDLRADDAMPSDAPAGEERPRLRSPGEPTAPRSATAADAAHTVPAGSGIVVQMIDGIDSETDRAGQVFTASVAEPVMVGGVEVVPRGADVRGRIVNAEGAGRVRGSAELRLELTQIVVNGIPYALTTAEYAEVGEGRGGETARRVGTAAGLGALIGVIAGGGKGVAIGAGVGAGAAGTVQILTKGEKIYIPAETLLGFTLKEPLVVARR